MEGFTDTVRSEKQSIISTLEMKYFSNEEVQTWDPQHPRVGGTSSEVLGCFHAMRKKLLELLILQPLCFISVLTQGASQGKSFGGSDVQVVIQHIRWSKV